MGVMGASSMLGDAYAVDELDWLNHSEVGATNHVGVGDGEDVEDAESTQRLRRDKTSISF